MDKPVKSSNDLSREPVAIIGMACRFPGGVADPEGFWRMIWNKTDALCRHRRSKGLAATSLNWGAISEVGILSRKTDVAAWFEKAGIGAMHPGEACTVLDHALQQNITRAGAFRIDWKKWALAHPVFWRHALHGSSSCSIRTPRRSILWRRPASNSSRDARLKRISKTTC